MNEKELKKEKESPTIILQAYYTLLYKSYVKNLVTNKF